VEIILRVSIIYFFLMLGFRVLGKRELSEFSPFELVTLMIIPEIVSQALVREAALSRALVGIATLFGLVFLTSLLGYRWKRLGSVIEGHPTLLIHRGKLIAEALHRERLSPEELYGEMRKAGIKHLSQVEVALLENDGKLAFLQREGGQKVDASRQGSAGAE
jgi:uncharacterized membrane protein YcaP (DUF421 family)